MAFTVTGLVRLFCMWLDCQVLGCHWGVLVDLPGYQVYHLVLFFLGHVDVWKVEGVMGLP